MVAEGFTEQETALIRNMMVSRDAKYIATLLDSDPSKVKEALLQLSDLTGIVSRQQQIDEQRALKKKTKESMLWVSSKTSSAGVMSQEDFIAWQKRQAAAPMPKPLTKAKKASIIKQDAKKLDRIIRLNQNEASRVAREKAKGPKFVTKQIDYNVKKTLRIDSKTFIYINQDEDEEAAKARFFKAYPNFRSDNDKTGIKEVKTKECKRCKTPKQLKDFYKSSRMDDHRDNICSDCRRDLEEIRKRQSKLK